MDPRGALRAIRRLLPPAGAQYETFNLAVAFTLIVSVNYLVLDPNPTSQRALAWLLGPTPLVVWGTLLTTAGLVGIIGSYRSCWLPIALAGIAAASFCWSAALFVGFIGEMADPQLADLGALTVSVLYGYFARQAVHEAVEA